LLTNKQRRTPPFVDSGAAVLENDNTPAHRY
jgi:hypothetical protein